VTHGAQQCDGRIPVHRECAGARRELDDHGNSASTIRMDGAVLPRRAIIPPGDWPHEEGWMQFENLICARADDVMTVTLNRPAKLNSLSLGLLQDLRHAAEAMQRDRALRAVLLTGAGRGFCAGADLTDPSSVPAAGQSMGQFMASRLRSEYNIVAAQWCNLPVPLVVALNGVAAGAGASLALMGDITVAARSASLTFLFAPKLGLAPDMGATHFLARRIGEARARYYAMTGAPISAETAERIGLVAECVDDQQLPSRAEALAGELAAAPREALVAVRALMARAGTSSLPEQLELEADAQSRLGDSADFREGVSAFIAKRPPRFGGH
jgi:2-(1,2-epoxy-1,2-dihydrophenyl)acetyl-CoA isomerase